MFGNLSVRPTPTPTEVPMRLSKMAPEFKRIIGVQLKEFIHEIDELGYINFPVTLDMILMFENNEKSNRKNSKRAS